MEINISQLIEPKSTAMVGRDDGRKFRKALEEKHGQLIKLEKDNDKLEFLFPKTIITMNKSFFLGAFADRIEALGTAKFIEKYDFSSSSYIHSKIEDYCEYALKTTSIDDIING